jgi:potassium-transporting ATPase potassium-binding subunit
MNATDITLLILFFAALFVGTRYIGAWLANVLTGEPPALLRWLAPLERGIYRAAGVDPNAEMSWRHYAANLMVFNLFGGALILLLQLLQGYLPLNPLGCGAVPLGVAVNTAMSFLTNTNWQAYSGESTLSYLTQMAGLGVQNFLSAATGIAVLAALARGFSRKSASTLGNFWADLVRPTLYVLVPLAAVLAVVLVTQGVVMSFAPYAHATTLAGTEQVIPLGPAASQIAIKQIGTNGGGFFGVNSAHPFENPTALSNFLEMLALLLLPAACVNAYGRLTGARKHAFVVLAAMTLFFVGAFGVSMYFETHPPVALGNAAHTIATEGKETRIGIAASVLWANATTVASNGSVNAMHSSLSPIAGGMAIWNMLLGEVIFGGIGSGMYGMAMMIVITVFLAGLMVGRTPEYLGKKINAREIRLAAIAVLAPCALVLIGCTASFLMESGRAACGTAGPHALSEILYAWTSMSNNNGSAFGSLTATGNLYTWGGALAMFLGRFIPIVCVLAFAGGVANKKSVPASSGTFPTDGALFAVLLCGCIAIIAGLTFFPALALGPVLEQMLISVGTIF